MGSQTIAVQIRDLLVSGKLYKPDINIEVHDEEYSDTFRISVTAHWDGLETTVSAQEQYLPEADRDREALLVVRRHDLIQQALDLLGGKIADSTGLSN